MVREGRVTIALRVPPDFMTPGRLPVELKAELSESPDNLL
jgi:hypothetical protein